MTLCVICCHLDNLKNVKNTHRGVLLLVKLQVEAPKLLPNLKGVRSLEETKRDV